MKSLELTEPLCLGPVDQTTVDEIAEQIPYETSLTHESGSIWFNQAMTELSKPIANSLREKLGLYPTKDLKLVDFLMIHSLREPNEPLLPYAGEWHRDGARSGLHLIVMSSTAPTEILVGKTNSKKLGTMFGESATTETLDSFDFHMLGAYFEDFMDDELPFPELGIAQLRPYHAYEFDFDKFHRSPINKLGKPMARTLINMTFEEL
jgi:hypothetical protein